MAPRRYSYRPLPSPVFKIAFSLAPRYMTSFPGGLWTSHGGGKYRSSRWPQLLAEWEELYHDTAPADSRLRAWFEAGAPTVHAPANDPNADCYAARYKDLHATFCRGGTCNAAKLRRHWKSHGQREGRVFECTAVDASVSGVAVPASLVR